MICRISRCLAALLAPSSATLEESVLVSGCNHAFLGQPYAFSSCCNMSQSMRIDAMMSSCEPTLVPVENSVGDGGKDGLAGLGACLGCVFVRWGAALSPARVWRLIRHHCVRSRPLLLLLLFIGESECRVQDAIQASR
ncbi:hypothetical protein B0T10DRAFT_502843 [Thelonectria olida]|uniref:Secreted protein n=1 Tax=Thelonectria olida TaxID=1576542 RepID=A0A9P8VNI5_9HYPO|nr:hypothetical protein B0T10DRAFT_502843 [Thelonectria olida]